MFLLITGVLATAGYATYKVLRIIRLPGVLLLLVIGLWDADRYGEAVLFAVAGTAVTAGVYRLRSAIRERRRSAQSLADLEAA